MKITDKILSIPPFISTTWENVSSLHLNGSDLCISLLDGAQVVVPHLSEETLTTLFEHHARITESQLEEEEKASTNPFAAFENLGGLPLFGSMGGGLSDWMGMGNPMEHNPAQSEAPDLPLELLSKVAQLTKMLAPEQLGELPQPVPHCNCMHCQLARALQKEEGASTSDQGELEEDEPVKDEELSFCQWDISKVSDHLYQVRNRLDESEMYQVHLADPVGCTCGQSNCEHILAVLRS